MQRGSINLAPDAPTGGGTGGATPPPATSAPAAVPANPPAAAATPAPPRGDTDPSLRAQFAAAPGAPMAGAIVNPSGAPANALTIDPAEASAEDLATVKEVFFVAIEEVAKQGRAEVALFVNTMAPTAAVYLARSRGGDEQAAMLLDAVKRQSLMMAATFGVRLLQTSEAAFLAAINVGLRLALGPIGGAVAQAAVATAGAVAGAKRG